MNAFRVEDRQAVFATPWFELVAKRITGDPAPHYSIATDDYVSVLARTREGSLVMVRQYRAAVEAVTLELPGGHVDKGDTPENAARTELREETGFVADEFILLGHLAPDTGRLANRLWCFFAPEARQDPAAHFEAEPNVEPILYPKSLRELVLSEPTFSSAINRATILMAIAGGHLEL